MSDLSALFRGIAVLIDDEVAVPNSEIDQLANQIQTENCHVIRISDLPSDAQLDTLAEAAFFILDWNLHPVHSVDGNNGLPLVKVPSTLSGKHIRANIDFLKKIRERRFAPVFIFTNEDAETVKKTLSDAQLFSDGPSDHIFVQAKSTALTAGVFSILTDWIKGHPSAYVLKCWETAYAKTRNSFFVDFYSLSHLWPVVLWRTYQEDSVSEAAELTSMICRNIISRLAPVPFDPLIVAAENHMTAVASGVDGNEIRKVLEGERFIQKERLQEEVSVGDVFKAKGKYYVNLRPECDCVARDGAGEDEIILYLIGGSKVSDNNFHKTFNSDAGNFIDKEITGTVFAMHEGVTVCFQFKDFQTARWGDWKDKRIGRLIPPYSTKLQQRFASFIQRIGLARIPTQAVPIKDTEQTGDDVANPSNRDYSILDHVKAIFSKLTKRKFP